MMIVSDKIMFPYFIFDNFEEFDLIVLIFENFFFFLNDMQYKIAKGLIMISL